MCLIGDCLAAGAAGKADAGPPLEAKWEQLLNTIAVAKTAVLTGITRVLPYTLGPYSREKGLIRRIPVILP